MIRDEKVTYEARQIGKEIWKVLRLDGCSERGIPDIDSKQGGASGCYYHNIHTVYVRSNVWKKLTLAQKRLLMIHELYHSLNQQHKPGIYLSSADYLSRRLYMRIWGNDEHLQDFDTEIENELEKVIGNERL